MNIYVPLVTHIYTYLCTCFNFVLFMRIFLSLFHSLLRTIHICMCACIYVFVYACMHARATGPIQKYIYACTTYVYTSMTYVYMRACMYACIYLRNIHAYMCTYSMSHIHLSMRAFMSLFHIHIHTHIYIHICVHVCLYACVCLYVCVCIYAHLLGTILIPEFHSLYERFHKSFP